VPGAQSPVDALVKHVKNPALYNFTTNGVSLPEQAHPLLKRAPAQPPAPAHLNDWLEPVLRTAACDRRLYLLLTTRERCT